MRQPERLRSLGSLAVLWADESARPCLPRTLPGIFNNVAVAAAHVLAVHGLRRVAIVDFDVRAAAG